jgi:hypothetical protein
MIKCYSTCNYFHLMTVVFQNDFPKMHSVNRSLINDLHQPYFVHVSKKNSTGKGKATLTDIAWSRHSRRTQPTDGLRSYGTNRSRSKNPKLWSPITNGPATIVHSATAQTGGWHAGDGTREQTRHSERIFLTRPEIHPTRGSNPRPRGATRKPQPTGLRTFRFVHVSWA